MHGCINAVEQLRAVGQARDFVVVGQLLDALLGFTLGGDVLDDDVAMAAARAVGFDHAPLQHFKPLAIATDQPVLELERLVGQCALPYRGRIAALFRGQPLQQAPAGHGFGVKGQPQQRIQALGQQGLALVQVDFCRAAAAHGLRLLQHAGTPVRRKSNLRALGVVHHGDQFGPFGQCGQHPRIGTPIEDAARGSGTAHMPLAAAYAEQLRPQLWPLLLQPGGRAQGVFRGSPEQFGKSRVDEHGLGTDQQAKPHGRRVEDPLFEFIDGRAHLGGGASRRGGSFCPQRRGRRHAIFPVPASAGGCRWNPCTSGAHGYIM